MTSSSTSSLSSKMTRRFRFLKLSAASIGAASIPVAVWWYYARQKRDEVAHEVATKIRIPGQQTVDDFMVEKCRPGDVVLFDRRWETCASGPLAALACILTKALLCHSSDPLVVDNGSFDHIGIIVPGYVRQKHDEFDPTNLLLLEATSSGLVARSLKTRLEYSQSRSVVLMQLNVPGERREFQSTNYDDDDEKDESKLSSRELSVRRTRQFMERELIKFRDSWVTLGKDKHFEWLYSTLAVGGALAYGTGLNAFLQGPVSPSAWLVLMGLQQAAAATNLHEKQERFAVRPINFLQRLNADTNPMRLRPGYRFLAPIALRDHHTN